MSRAPSRIRSWLTRRGVQTYRSYAEMPVALRLMFMGLCGLGYLLALSQMNHLRPVLSACAEWLNTPKPLAQLDARSTALLLLVAAYTVWLLGFAWVSGSIFRTCKRSLEAELFR